MASRAQAYGTGILWLPNAAHKIILTAAIRRTPPRDRVDLGPKQGYRLVGVGLSNFREPEGSTTQPALFE